MNSKIGIALFTLMILFFSPCAYSAIEEDSIFTARDKVYPALVNIGVVGKGYQNGRLRRFPAAGSGVIVSPEGHVLTNFHVAGETTRITCKLPDGRVFLADPVVLDPLTDLAVLKLRLDEDDLGDPLPVAALGDSSKLEIGDDVLAMGNPQTLSSSMTRGIVSNPRRVFMSFTGSDMDEVDLGGGQRTGLFTRWIQHDALILGGNSGGPLVNLKGEVIGINDRGGSGMSFAIPSNLAADVLNEALEYGEVRRGWFGLSFKPVDKLGAKNGALITSVVEGSPADKAGMVPGDVLVSVNGEPVHVGSFEEIPPLLKRISDIKPGEIVKMEWNHGDGSVTADVKSEPLEKFLGDEAEIRPWGITVRDVTGQMAMSRRFPDADGVMVTGIRPGRPGEKAEPSLKGGDIIRTVDGNRVNGHEGLMDMLRDSEPGSKRLVEIRREDANILTVIEIAKERDDMGGGELPRAWVGIETQVLSAPVAEALGLKGTGGFRVTRVYPDTKAEEAGIQVGDIITTFDKRPLRATRSQDAQQLMRRIEQRPVGSTSVFGMVRGDEEMSLEIEFEGTPAERSESDSADSEVLEFAVRDQTYMDGITTRWPDDSEGVVVTEVTGGGWASLAGLRQGDLVVSINDELVPDTEAFTAAIDSIESTRPDIVKIFVVRAYRTTFVFLEPEWPADAGS